MGRHDPPKATRYDIHHVFTASYRPYTLWTIPALLFTKLWGQRIEHLRAELDKNQARRNPSGARWWYNMPEP